jgi:formylglycine-generating enzyme required for sulfatase activity
MGLWNRCGCRAGPSANGCGAVRCRDGEEHQQAWAKHLGVPVEWTNSIGMRFTLIPPGEFMMGSSQEEFENMVERFPALKDILPNYRSIGFG